MNVELINCITRAASVTSYIFRFKPDVEQLFNARNSHIIKQMALGPTW